MPIAGIPYTEIVMAIVAFVLGFLVGYLIKNVIKIGIIVLAIIVILIAIGVVSPHTVVSGLQSMGVYATQAEQYVSRIINYLPYNSILFIIGFVIGLVKG
ncbi:hypothetical protein [Sulfolobus acidocaldarius]|uniref:Uncharacterized protein n=4 Tax=Sulfolobus acidocaldarius TaxID=2285 RepID=A0A0U3GRG5_9CREN|nr:hypothetical protein [Sulfolobus acidocaldarius]AAY80563.1 hypothetical membrane protein [Sulfolobus acidocaldarius DSM 639]AGE71152.1 hypothetical protein SacN8_05935 [Sulfolobus acidocaldarius N8]AGE73422.1 hypothetical protein SacRon12I_05930 [Sulfolobus acidocaldarius Ron12/I]ALU28577.1 hypothetical protein ATY89_00415 [Sulfolobus acidocaldarius]ALU31289.1 hypothetical protein ATZ20_03460 [Sulfolobus acidocaldarius]